MHYILLYPTALYFIALYSIALHYITLNYVALHYIDIWGPREQRILVLITHLLNAHVRFALDLEKSFDVIIRIVRVEARLHSTFQISRWKQNRQNNCDNPKWDIILLQNVHSDLKYVHPNSFFSGRCWEHYATDR